MLWGRLGWFSDFTGYIRSYFDSIGLVEFFGFAIVSKGLFQASAGDLQFFYGVCYGIEETAASIADELESWELYVSG